MVSFYSLLDKFVLYFIPILGIYAMFWKETNGSWKYIVKDYMALQFEL